MIDDNFLKYYWLEKDYFPEIREFFFKEHYLKPEQFFAIVFWKSVRPRKLIKDGLRANGKSLDESVKQLTQKIFNEKNNSKKLQILLDNNKGFKVSMASAILTVLYPEDFTIYDYRVWNQVKNTMDQKEISNKKDVINLYWKFVKLVKEHTNNFTLRDGDRNLWGKSWHYDLQKFISD